MTSRGHVTALLERAAQGDADASAELIGAVYADLRRQASALMRQEKAGHTLQPTVLVHDAFMQLIGHERMSWQGRAHFFAVAATVMRRILVDHARKRNAARRGGGAPRLSLEDGLGLSTTNETDVLELHDALNRLETLDARQAEVVALRFFGGLTVPEVAAILGVSTRTVEGDWAMARAWLLREMTAA
ncbi:MAG: sigma-70 family RNA polymerase sigma factor [Deltaproteobacteria bacterium]|nr:sigma-70 family RNA polymerase sigma factor [Deltaproteobacteria bacterium]MCB9788658.1 sigma-70 family RNA polymerase sigma factor [Deltaproteobacteria bacterium]